MVVAATVAAAGSSALGLGVSPGSQVAVPQLQPPAQLPSPPQVSVPQAPSTPSVPHVQAPSTPSVPQVHTPSTPSVGGATHTVGGATGALPRAGTSSGGGGGGATGGGSPSTSTGGSGGNTPSGSSHPNGQASVPPSVQRLRNRHARLRDLILQAMVHKFHACLGSLPAFDRRLLVMRAGLGGAAPMSRAAAAQKLGISGRRAGQIEKRSVRSLKSHCTAGGPAAGGGFASAGGFGARTVFRGVPALRPTTSLASAGGGGHPTQADTAAKTISTSGSHHRTRHSSRPVATASPAAPITGSYGYLGILLGALGAGLAVLALVAFRRWAVETGYPVRRRPVRHTLSDLPTMNGSTAVNGASSNGSSSGAAAAEPVRASNVAAVKDAVHDSNGAAVKERVHASNGTAATEPVQASNGASANGASSNGVHEPEPVSTQVTQTDLPKRFAAPTGASPAQQRDRPSVARAATVVGLAWVAASELLKRRRR